MSDTAQQPDRLDSADQAKRNSAAIFASALSLELDDRRILEDINLKIPVGATVALLGANGAGKSTLLRILATLAHPSGGRLELFGHHVGAAAWKVRSRIGLIAHQPMLYRDLTLRENLEFFGKLYKVSDAPSRAKELLEMVGLAHRADDPVKTLSRGMTQRVAIARALMHDPDLLLADEPFNGLDAPSIIALEQFLARLKSEGKTVILSNHNISQTLRLADYVCVLRAGQLVLDGPADQFNEQTIMREISGG